MSEIAEQLKALIDQVDGMVNTATDLFGNISAGLADLQGRAQQLKDFGKGDTEDGEEQGPDETKV